MARPCADRRSWPSPSETTGAAKRSRGVGDGNGIRVLVVHPRLSPFRPRASVGLLIVNSRLTSLHPDSAKGGTVWATPMPSGLAGRIRPPETSPFHAAEVQSAAPASAGPLIVNIYGEASLVLSSMLLPIKDEAGSIRSCSHAGTCGSPVVRAQPHFFTGRVVSVSVHGGPRDGPPGNADPEAGGGEQVILTGGPSLAAPVAVSA